MSQQIKLLVGLANPGPEYARTRHNAGAWVVEELARVHNVTLKNEPKFFGLTGRIMVNGQDLRLLIPTTFMNLSGKSIAALAKFYQIKPEEIMVAHDELDLPPGVAKFKKKVGVTVDTTVCVTPLANWAITKIFIVFVLALVIRDTKIKWRVLY